MITALIHPDGHLTPLSGSLSADPASVAALAHAVHAASCELALRIGTAPVQWVTLRGLLRSLTLLTIPQGVLVLEHDPEASSEVVQAMASAWIAHLSSASASQSVPVPVTAPFSLADALHATAP